MCRHPNVIILFVQVFSACVMVRLHSVLLLAVALCGAATTLDSELGLGKAINIFMRLV